MTAPRYPVFIPSKSRAEIATTPHVLDRLGVPYRLIVEADQVEEYAAVFDRSKIVTLDPSYQESYETCDDLGATKSRGPGPARNFAWDLAVSEGAAWHWVMDDNIQLFARLHENQWIPVGDGEAFRLMEDFAARYRNVAMAGPDYWMFATSRSRAKPFTLNTRIYSCNLIRNDVPFRWRGRYNEDTDLSIQMLKAGWCTVLFKAFLQYKTTTQVLGGGNTEAFYAAEGTAPKSRMIVQMHPDVCRLARRFGRDHHVCDYGRFTQPLVARDDAPPVKTSKLRLRPRTRPE